jgi:hypothetical protein
VRTVRRRRAVSFLHKHRSSAASLYLTRYGLPSLIRTNVAAMSVQIERFCLFERVHSARYGTLICIKSL